MTKEEKLRILDIAINHLQKYNDIGMCCALNVAVDKVSEYNFIGKLEYIFPKYTRFNYFIKDPCWAIVKAFIRGYAFWDSFYLVNNQKETIKANKRRIKFLEYLKTTV